jgi:phenylacetate-coenzyme A ligase PaaK-like adenylate-forming protein
MMKNRDEIIKSVQALMAGDASFDETAESVFNLQLEHNPIYGEFAKLLNRKSYSILPFLPVEMFKSKAVKTGDFDPQVVFTSSGTTGDITSRHYVRETGWYEEIFTQTFAQAYRYPANFCFLCLLPSYLERDGSSLVYMAESLIKQSKYDFSGFYLNANDELVNRLQANEANGIPTVLLGVTFALLDLAEKHKLRLSDNTIVMETGGMKGRRKEMTRPELHGILTSAFGVDAIHSEYGMTELMSQAYSKGNGIFSLPPQMKIIITDVNDPFEKLDHGRTGTVNIIDLANIDSCAFLATKDLGRTFPDGTFEILGRYDHSDVRGCNLLIA